MDRRAFICTAACGVITSPLMARGQQTLRPVIGFLSSRSPEESAVHAAAFRRGLGDVGYIDGQNVAIEYRWAKGHYERLPALAGELVSRQVTVLMAVGGTPSALAAKAETATIPIVFLIGEDPVRRGLVASFNHPGGNLTGVSFRTGELGAKRLEFLCELVPNAATIALILNPNNQEAEAQKQDVQARAAALSRRLVILQATTERELESSLVMLARERAGGLIVENDPFFDSQRDRLVTLVARSAIPAIYHIREFPVAGGLMSYGASLTDAYRQVGTYAGQILNGEKAADLPIVQPTRFELVINAKTAKALGITVPGSLLLQADEVIR